MLEVCWMALFILKSEIHGVVKTYDTNLRILQKYVCFIAI